MPCAASTTRTAPSHAARLRETIATLAREHGARRLFVLDELINVHPAHFDHVLAAISEEGLRFELPNGLRADYLEPRHLAAMRGRYAELHRGYQVWVRKTA